MDLYIQSNWTDNASALNLSSPTDSAPALNLSSPTECTQSSSGDEEPVVEIVTYVAMCLSSAGMLSNVAAFISLLGAKCQQEVLRLGLLSLSIADFLIALSTTGLLAFSHHWRQADHGDQEGLHWHRKEWCANQIFRSLWAMATDANQLTLIFLAAQQFMMLRWPLKSILLLSTGRAAVALVSLWCLSAAFGFASIVVAYAATDDHPKVAFWSSKGTTRLCYQLLLYEQPIDHCGGGYKYPFGQTAHHRAFVWLGVALVVFVLASLCLSYGYMLAAFERIAKLGESSCQPLAAGQRRASWSGTRKVVLLVTAAVTGVCMLCYLPLFAYHTSIALGCEVCHREIYFPLLLGVVSIATIADPVIYTMRLKVMRASLLAALRKCWLGLDRSSSCHVRQTVGRSWRPQRHSICPMTKLAIEERAMKCDIRSF